MPPARRRPSAKKILGVVALVLVLLLAIPIAWIVHLYNYGQENLNRIDALSGAPDTPGTTYLIVGSDERSDAFPDDPTQGMRADTMMLLHVPESGTTALVSLPRDTFVTFPDDYGQGKLNASMAWGGPKLLVATVENLTGLTVDHYIQIGMEGVIDLTDAVGGINLCLDYDVDDYYSGLVWTAGCHDVDGETALAFARMRYADPLGDIGRTDRQRQVVSQIISEAVSRDTLLSPSKQKNLVGAVSSVLTIDENDSLLDIAKAGFSLRDVMGEGGVSGTPPISDMSYWHNGGSHVLLDPATIDQFWVDLRDGNLTQDSFSSF
ncbi:MAG: LCP family protein [Actinomycetaceae bacterium]|nr:LCP family protein [Actinomycetaceae bacterium]